MLQHWIVITELFWIPRVDDRSCTVFSFNLLLNHDIMYRNKMLMYMLFFKKITYFFPPQNTVLLACSCYLHKKQRKIMSNEVTKMQLMVWHYKKRLLKQDIIWHFSDVEFKFRHTHTHTHTIWAGRDYSAISQLSQLLISIISGSQIIRYQLKIFAPKFSTVLYCAFSFLG